mmetsp:Transcript_30233/g.55547  ORF Transcript_30233/g.55547 Transcript_30233/m.55547 type:complete len:352 (+) Transcript_30233:57-1112(+)
MHHQTNMVQSFTALLLLLVATLTAVRSVDATAAQQHNHNPRPRSATNDNGVPDHNNERRRTKFIQYNYSKCPQVPSLHCRNDSYCTPGTANFGKKHDHLDLQTNELGYFCECQPGFIGHECEIELDDCTRKGGDPSDPLHSCYNGAACQDSQNGFTCNCEEVNESRGSSEAKFAGKMCQHESTSMCAASLSGTYAPNHQFCTNHGECFKMVSGGEPHPGCICKPGWTGNHCELRKDPFAVPRMEEGVEEEKSGANLMALWSLMIIPMIVGGLLAYKVDGVIKMQRAREEAERSFQGANGSMVSADDLDADGSGTLGVPSVIGDESSATPSDDDEGADGEDEEGDVSVTKIV